MKKSYDVAVIGAGPAGSTAAREAAARGLSAVLVDKADFPRDKPCGGGVTTRCSRLLPFDIAPVTERRVTSVVFTAPGAEIERRTDHALTFLTQRRLLDTFLVERAQEAGAHVLQRAGVTAIESTGHMFEIAAGANRFRARFVIAADGANGPTARLTGIPVSRWTGIALEGNITLDPFPDKWNNAISIDFGHISGGYGWLFPKGDHVNVGLGGWSGSGPTLRARLDRLVRWYGYRLDQLWNLRGHPLPVRRPGSPLASDRVLLAGDAAGLLDPFTGEGIFAAIWSGRQAAHRIADHFEGEPAAAGRSYAEDVGAHLLPDLRVSRKMADLFHLAPWLWTQGLRSSPVWDLACRLLTGDQTYAAASRGAGWKSSSLSLLYESLKLVSRSRRAGESVRPLLFAS